MPSNEDLYQQSLREEEDEAERRRRQLGTGDVRTGRDARMDPTLRPRVNAKKAMERYEKEIAPVLEARRRVEAGLPPTDSILDVAVHGFRKLLGLPVALQDGIEVIQPGEVMVVKPGMTEEEVRQDMIAHPELYKGVSRPAPEVHQVAAIRKTAQDLRGDR